MRRFGAAALVVFSSALVGCELVSSIIDRAPAPTRQGSGDGSGLEGAPEGPSAVPEIEPNDTPDTAHRLAVGRPIEGSVSAEDVDRYALPAGVRAASVTVRGQGVERVEVRRPQDAAIASFPATAGGVVIPAMPRDASAVLSVHGTGPYTLLVADTDAAAPCGILREPDDIARPGLTLDTVPATAVGCIAEPGDMDVIRVPADALADVPGLGIALSAVESVAFELRLKDDSGRVLISVAGEAGEDLLIPNVARPDTGSLIVEVRSVQGASESAPYRLSLRRLSPLNGTIELEPNDDSASATRVVEIGLVNGYLHRPGDVDHYELTSDEAQLVRMWAESPAGVDLKLRVEREGAGTLEVDASAAGGQEQICSIRLSPESPFSFGVVGGPADVTTAEPYLLHFERLEGGTWEIEPNDTAEVALTAARGRTDVAPVDGGVGVHADAGLASSVSGYSFPDGDVDHFVIDVAGDPAAAVTYSSVTVTLQPNGAADYALELLDEDGASLGRSDAGRVGESESVALDLPAGSYVASVRRVSGEACGRPYVLAVRKTDFPDPAAVPSEGSGELREGSGEPPARPEQRLRPRLNVQPPPTAPTLDSGALGRPRPRTWGAPARAPGEQPPTFGGESGR
jgi:hypothetical protein